MDKDLEVSDLIAKIDRNKSFEEVSESLEKLMIADSTVAIEKSIEILDENGLNFELEVLETALSVLSECAPAICIEKAKKIIKNQQGDFLLETAAFNQLFYIDRKYVYKYLKSHIEDIPDKILYELLKLLKWSPIEELNQEFDKSMLIKIKKRIVDNSDQLPQNVIEDYEYLAQIKSPIEKGKDSYDLNNHVQNDNNSIENDDPWTLEKPEE